MTDTAPLTDCHRRFCDGSNHVPAVGFYAGDPFEDEHGETTGHGVDDQCMCGHVPYWLCPDFLPFDDADSAESPAGTA